jgi:hypothetical protein
VLVDDAKARDHPRRERARDGDFESVGPVAELVDVDRDGGVALWGRTSTARGMAGRSENDEEQSAASHLAAFRYNTDGAAPNGDVKLTRDSLPTVVLSPGLVCRLVTSYHSVA